MKPSSLGKFAFLLSTLALGASSYGAAIAIDNASDSAYNSGWADLSNGGAGFAAWSLLSGSNSGTFLGTSGSNGNLDGNIDTTIPPVSGSPTTARSWGTYANSGDNFNAFRPFTLGGTNSSNILGVSQQFSISMDNGYVDGTVGFGLQNSSATNRIELYFVGGGSDYTLNISGTTLDTGIAFTIKGLSAVFTQGASNSWTLGITPNGGSTTVFSNASTGVSLAQSDISQVHLFNANGGSLSTHDSFFNSIQVATVPEPSTLLLIGATLGGWFAVRRKRA